MASASETKNHNGIDISAPSSSRTFRNRAIDIAIAYLFVGATIVLLLASSRGSKEDNLAADVGYGATDDWDDDDNSDVWDQYTSSALGDD